MSRKILFTFILVTLLFFSPVLFSGKSLFYYDTLSPRLPGMIFFKDEILSNRLPLWNPYLYAGLPHLADPTNNVLSPFNIFYLLLPPILAINVITALAVFLAGVGMYFFAKNLGLGKIASLFTGLAFLFCGSSLTLVNDINSLLAVSFIPWIFFCFTKWSQTEKQYWFLLTVFATTFQFFSGHPQYIYWTWIFLGFFSLLYFQKISLKQKFKKISLAALFFIGLSAIQLLPFLELMKNSFRPSDIQFVSNSQFQFIQIPRLFLVNFYGQLKSGTSWGPGSLLETGLGGIDGYIGFLSLTFFILALFLRIRKLRSLFFLSFLALFLSFGMQLPFYNFLRHLLPFFKFFRSPSRVLIFWSFFSILIAGLVFDGLLKGKTPPRWPDGLLGGGGIILLLIWQKGWFIETGLKSFIFIYQFVKHQPLNTFIYGQEKLKIILNLWHENLVVILLGLTTLYLFLYKKSLWPLVFVFLIFEGFWFGKNEFLTAPRELMSANHEITGFLQEKSELNRVISTGEIVPFTGLQAYWSHLRSRPPFSKNNIDTRELKEFPRFKKEVNMLPVNSTENYKLFNPSGYTAVVLKNYASFWDSKVANSVTIEKIDDKRLDFLGTKYFITGYPADFIKDKHENLELIKDFKDIKIYENKNVYPRAFLIDENEKFLKEAKIISYLPSKVKIETGTEKPAKLVLTDSFYPGWGAKVDGKETEIKPFKKTFRSVLIPHGRHLVTFNYFPKSFVLGSIISVGTLIGLIYVILRRSRRISYL